MDLKDYVDLNLIPFGKSSYKTQGSDTIFDCHHGEIECYGNKIHACAISHIQVDSFQMEHTRESLIVDYITCLMGGGFKDEPYADFAKDCATRTHVKKFDPILNCANSTEGSELLKAMGEKTIKFEQPLRSVPTITIRESFDLQVQQDSLNDFARTVCIHLPKPTPNVCRQYNGATSISAFTALFTVLIAAALHLMK